MKIKLLGGELKIKTKTAFNYVKPLSIEEISYSQRDGQTDKTNPISSSRHLSNGIKGNKCY